MKRADDGGSGGVVVLSVEVRADRDMLSCQAFLCCLIFLLRFIQVDSNHGCIPISVVDVDSHNKRQETCPRDDQVSATIRAYHITDIKA